MSEQTRIEELFRAEPFSFLKEATEGEQETFVVGDLVTWTDAAKACHFHMRYSCGHFEVIEVTEVPKDKVSTTGHFQRIKVKGIAGDLSFSGIWFKKEAHRGG